MAERFWNARGYGTTRKAHPAPHPTSPSPRRYNTIGAEGAEALSRALPSLTCLRILHLESVAQPRRPVAPRLASAVRGEGNAENASIGNDSVGSVVRVGWGLVCLVSTSLLACQALWRVNEAGKGGYDVLICTARF